MTGTTLPAVRIPPATPAQDGGDDSSVQDAVYFACQTPFMRRLLEESVETWSHDESAMPRFSMITSTNYALFDEGILDVTRLFDITLSCWVPVLFTWIQCEDEAHHRPHFRHLNRCIIGQLQSSTNAINVEAQYLLHVGENGLFHIHQLISFFPVHGYFRPSATVIQ